MMQNLQRAAWLLTGFMVLGFFTGTAFSATITAPSGAELMVILVNKSQLLTFDKLSVRVSVVEPAIADVQVLDPTQVLITGKTVGETSLIIWLEDGQTRMYDLRVQLNLDVIQKALQRVIPGETIEIVPIDDGIALQGYVSRVELADRALQVAQSFAPQVINLLEVPGRHQVLLKVKVAEVARSFRENLGVDFYFNNRGMYTGSGLGELSSGSLDGGQIDVTDAANLFFGLRSTNVDLFVEALQTKGLLEILAEPNLVARSGETATFLAGGEFPVPVVQGGMSDSVTIEYKEYGVRLNFTPTVLSDTTIHLDVAPEVSDLDFGQGVQFGGYVIPLLLTRRAHTVVKMETGQTFAIAGLISQTRQKSRRKVPVMGDLPVFGNLFKTRTINANETELLIMVTPEIVSPLRPDQAQIKIGETIQPAIGTGPSAEVPVQGDTSMLYLKTQKVVGPEIKAATQTNN